MQSALSSIECFGVTFIERSYYLQVLFNANGVQMCCDGLFISLPNRPGQPSHEATDAPDRHETLGATATTL
jgi:hypothetical protein